MVVKLDNFEPYLVNESSSVRDCMLIIDSNKKGAVLVVDSNLTLKGTLSDGDLRRAILNGATTEDSIENIYFKNPISLGREFTEAQARTIFKINRVSMIPVVNKTNLKLENVLIWSTSIEEYPALENSVVLMVGGLGSRLAPLTDNTPKPLLKVGNKPILETIFNRLRTFGFRNIILCTGYRHDDIERYCGNGKKFGLNIRYFKEEKRLGTIGAIKYLEKYLSLPFLVMNGDLLTLLNYRNILNYHLETESDLTIGSTTHKIKVPYGVLDIEGIQIKQIIEKPTYDFRVSGGIYVMNPILLEFIPKGKYFDITDLMTDALYSGKKLIAFPIEEYWMDIGQINDYKQANNDFFDFFN